MSERPGSFALAKESAQFVFTSMGILFHQIKILFPAMLVLSLIDILCDVYAIQYVPFATALISVYLYACLALTWHRYSLSGNIPSSPINPLSISREDFKFIRLFFLLAIIPVLMGVALGAIAGGGQAVAGQAGLVMAFLIIIPVFIYAFIQFLRYSFKLPAKSLGVDLSFADAKRASRGMISRILLAGFFIGVAAAMVLLVYAIISGISVGFASGGEEPGDIAKVIMGVVLGAPVLLIFVVLTAINITILSKAYQWGIQNNVIEAGEAV